VRRHRVFCAADNRAHLTYAVAVLLALTVFVPHAHTATVQSTSDKSSRIKAQLQQQEERIKESQEMIGRLKGEIIALNARMLRKSQEVSRLNENLSLQKERLRQQQENTMKARIQLAEAKKRVMERLGAYYAAGGPPDLIRALLSSNTLHDLLTMENAYGSMMQSDRDLLDTWKTKARAFETEEAQTKNEQKKTTALLAQLEKEQTSLHGFRWQKEKLVRQEETAQELFANAVSELRAALKRLGWSDKSSKSPGPAPRAPEPSVAAPLETGGHPIVITPYITLLEGLDKKITRSGAVAPSPQTP